MRTPFTDEQIIKIAKASLTEEEAKHFDDCQGNRQIEQFQSFAANVLEAWLAQQTPVAWLSPREDFTQPLAYVDYEVDDDHRKTFTPLFLAPPTAKQEPTSYQFQDRNGQWKDFLDQRHYENTVEDGSWPIRALYTAPQTAMEGWQSIETAPKDGTEILLRSRKGHIANGLWMTANDKVGAWIWAYVNLEPTHWQPLPPPPGEKK